LPPESLAWLVWGLGACLYLIAFYQRVAPAVMTRELSRDFGLSAASLGNLSAFYFYGYVLVQIPTGLLADRWGPRRVLTFGAAMTAAGTLLFALAPGVEWASAGRFAIGCAAGVAFVSMLKLATHWMPPKRFAKVTGIALTTGVVGATLAGVPLRAAVDAFGWRGVMVASAIVTALVAVAIWTVARDDPSERGYASYYPSDAKAPEQGSIFTYLREALRHRNILLMLVVPGGYSGLVLTFAGLWGVPWLVTTRGFTPSQAAATASMMLIAWSLSTIAYAHWSERIGRRKPVLAAGLTATVLSWAALVFLPDVPRAVTVALIAVVGIASGAVMLTFAFAKESVPHALGGTVSGITNMGMMLGTMVMQPVVGIILDLNWRGALVDGARIYDAAAYRAGFAAMLAWAVLALGLLALMKETGCRVPR
jgi:predicted MFS family arabinose efflux permease